MLRGRTLRKTWAATAIAGAALLAVWGDGNSVSSNLTNATAVMVGARAANAQNAAQEFPDSYAYSSPDSQSAMNRFRGQRANLQDVEATASEEASSSMSPKDYAIIALTILLAGAVAFPFARPRLSALRRRMSLKLAEKSHGAKMLARGGRNDESGRVAAARLAGRSESDVSLKDNVLAHVQQDLLDDSFDAASAVANQADAQVGAGLRVASVVMPSADAIARSPISPAMRRDRTGMAEAASQALRGQSALRSDSVAREDSGAAPIKGRDKPLAIQRITLSDRADRMYRDLQRYYGFGSRTQLKGLLTEAMFTEIEQGLANQDGSGIPQVLSLMHEVGEVRDDGTQYVGQVFYQVTLRFEGSAPEQSQEVFTFVKSKTPGTQHWKLQSIQSAEAAQPQASAQQERMVA